MEPCENKTVLQPKPDECESHEKQTQLVSKSNLTECLDTSVLEKNSNELEEKAGDCGETITSQMTVEENVVDSFEGTDLDLEKPLVDL